MADVAQLVQFFEEAEFTTDNARKLSERDRDYYDGKQWTDDQIRVMEKRKQPVVTYNRIKRKIDFMSGLEKQQRKDPKAFPRNPDDEDAARAATDGLRYICDKEKWDNKRSGAWKNLLIEGTAAVLVDVKQCRYGFDPSITRIPWDRFFFDPKASDQFMRDARYMGIVTWYDLDEAKEKWPGASEVLDASMSGSSTDTYEDKPRYKTWSEPRSKRVRVCEIYYRERGVWMRAVFTQMGFIENPAKSPYVDEDGRPENPIKAASLYVDRDNDRYGEVRVLISPQDEINKRRSKGLHLITMRQARVSRSSGQTPEKIRSELAKPDGIIVADEKEFEILPTNDMAAANLQLLQEAKAEIDLLGANAALQGKNENDMSGRAILAQQQGGMVEVADPFDILRELTLAVYEAIWNRIRQVWDSERWIRVTDDDRNLRFVGLNQQVTVGQIAQEVQQGKPEGMQSAAKLVGPQVMQAFMAGDQRAQMMLGLFVQQHKDQVVETRNAINELDVDIVIDEGMDTPTVQAEQFDTLAKIMPGLTQLPPPYAKLLIMASSLRDKDQLLDELEKMSAPNPMAQQQQQLAMAGAQAEVEKTQSETAKNYAQAQTAGMQPDNSAENYFKQAEVAQRGQEIGIDAYRAQTERHEAMKPEPKKEAA